MDSVQGTKVVIEIDITGSMGECVLDDGAEHSAVLHEFEIDGPIR